MKPHIALLAAALSLCGCVSYQYRLVEPKGVTQPISEQAAIVSYAPLEYHLSKYHDRLLMEITNPTDEQITLRGERSSVVDPAGESHPLRGQVLAPRSFGRLLLPPQPLTVAYPDYWGWGPYWGPYSPYWGPYYGWYGPPPMSYAEFRTAYDWTWKKGLIRLRLTYDRKGTTFEHYFEIAREER